MRNLCFNLRDAPYDEEQTSGFEFLFRDILPALAPLWWYWDRYEFNWMAYGTEQGRRDMAWFDERAKGQPFVPPGTLLPSLACYVQDFWTELWGFAERPSDPVMTGTGWRFPADNLGYDFIRRHAHVGFYNVDGGEWIIFSSDDSLLRMLEESRGKYIIHREETADWFFRGDAVPHLGAARPDPPR